MKFSDCFTMDIRSRTGQVPPVWDLIRRMILEPGYRAVVYYRIASYLKSATFARKPLGSLSRLILMRINRVPGLEIRTDIPIRPVSPFLTVHIAAVGDPKRIFWYRLSASILAI
jgi:hypothetical protein